MRCLVACEESQRTTIELRRLGHEAYSCDIQECSGGHPEWHFLQDVLPLLNPGGWYATRDGTRHFIDHWDLIIAHPPCTYLSNAGSCRLFPGGKLDRDRYTKGVAAKEFFLQCLNAKSPRVAVENPVPIGIFDLPPYSQIIEPWQFGHPFRKKTCLWLKGLPLLMPTNIVNQRESTKTAAWFNTGGKSRQKNRSKTFPGVALAMAEQFTQPLPEQLSIYNF